MIDEVKKEKAEQNKPNPGDPDPTDPEPVDPDRVKVSSFTSTIMINEQVEKSIGSLTLTLYDDSSVDIDLELGANFIEKKTGEKEDCSIRLTQYGDMRSFISSTAPSRSYGNSIEMVENFNCQGSTDVRSLRFLQANA